MQSMVSFHRGYPNKLKDHKNALTNVWVDLLTDKKAKQKHNHAGNGKESEGN